MSEDLSSQPSPSVGWVMSKPAETVENHPPPSGMPVESGIAHAPFPPKQSGMAVAAMVVGIVAFPLSWLIFGLVLGIVAIVLGHVSLSRINKSAGLVTGRGMAIAGLTLGYAGVAIVTSLTVLGFVVGYA